MYEANIDFFLQVKLFLYSLQYTYFPNIVRIIINLKSKFLRDYVHEYDYILLHSINITNLISFVGIQIYYFFLEMLDYLDR